MNNETKKSNEYIRLGVVGCGRVFERYHLPALKRSSDWQLIAICDPLKERREWVRKSFQGLSTFESFSTFLEQSSLDAVLITTPPTSHCQLTIQALEMGLHVLVEKPMASNPSEALLMLESSLRAQKQLQIGFNRRFRRPFLYLKKKLALVGKDSIRAIRFELVNNVGNWKSITPFFGDDSKGGGVLDDVVSHQVDLLPWLLDLDINGVKAEYIPKNKNGEEYVKYQLRFQNDLVADCLAGQGHFYSENLQIQLKDRKLIAYPSGVVEARRIPKSLIRYYCQLKTASHLIFHKLLQKPNVTLESFDKQLSCFAASIRGGNKSYIGADSISGVCSVRMIQACRVSMQSYGRWKPVPSREDIKQ